MSRSCKVHIFWEGHKILRNLHRRFVLFSNGQMYDGDFAKFCGLLRIYELYYTEMCAKIFVWFNPGQKFPFEVTSIMKY